ncbi:MAG TPA: M48 family metallopeptidase [Gemmatimonadales bacterium]|nr:M48 family metallopeptidase [Gemmatimonadales bacterium]
MSEAAAGNLFEQQRLNRRRTGWLIAAFVAFFAWLGFGGDYIYALSTAHAPPAAQHHVWWFGIVMLGVGAVVAAYAYRTGPEKVLWATDATELVDPTDARERQLVDVVEEMAIAAGIARPRIWLVPDADPNAFATGTDPTDAHIAVTQGLLDLCSRDELQAVVAHELGHVKNLDVRLMTTLAALVGAIVLVRDGTSRMFWGSGRRVSSGRDERKNDVGPLVAVLIALWILSWILAPIVTQLLALAVSRRREYLADAMGAQFTRNPLALASALQKIDAASLPTTHIKGGAAHMCIADPLGRRLTEHEGVFADALATHPPMAKRIAILQGMGYVQLKDEKNPVS